MRRARRTRTSPLAVSAYARLEDRNAALTAGFTTHVGKPITREQLLFALSAALRDAHRGAATAPHVP